MGPLSYLGSALWSSAPQGPDGGASTPSPCWELKVQMQQRAELEPALPVHGGSRPPLTCHVLMEHSSWGLPSLPLQAHPEKKQGPGRAQT